MRIGRAEYGSTATGARPSEIWRIEYGKPWIKSDSGRTSRSPRTSRWGDIKRHRRQPSDQGAGDPNLNRKWRTRRSWRIDFFSCKATWAPRGRNTRRWRGFLRPEGHWICPTTTRGIKPHRTDNRYTAHNQTPPLDIQYSKLIRNCRRPASGGGIRNWTFNLKPPSGRSQRGVFRYKSFSLDSHPPKP